MDRELLRIDFLTTEVHHAISTRQVIGSLIGIVGLIVVGIAVGVTVSKNRHSSSASSAASKGSSADNGGGSASGAVNQTNPNDPSSFVPNTALKHSFYGLAYTPAGSQLPDCGNSLGEFIAG